MPRAWIRLPSGRHLDLINPDPDAWLDSDLAEKLSCTFRWGGESAWPFPLSVAQHSLSVLALRQLSSKKTLSPGDALNELLHDAEEAFLGFDCNSPLKAVLGSPFRDVSETLLHAVKRRYALQNWSEGAYYLHKKADTTMAASEAMHCVGWSEAEIREILEIRDPILITDPLTTLYDCTPWEPWPSELAAERFHKKLEELINFIKDQESSLVSCTRS